jgi:hypothetical protein
VGKPVFCGKAKRSEKEQGEPEAEEGMEEAAPNSKVNLNGRARRQRGCVCVFITAEGGGTVGSWKPT